LEGGTLFISRTTAIFSWLESIFDDCGFKNVVLSVLDGDKFASQLKELKPKNVFINSEFYSIVTPYMIGELLVKFPKLKINIVNFGNFPDSIAVEFICNGANSYINFNDGIEEFKNGLRIINTGEEYYSQKIKQEIDLSSDNITLNDDVTKRENHVLLLACNGFTSVQIAANLPIEKRTVDKHISNIYKKLKVHKKVDLLRNVLLLGLVKIEQLTFHSTDIKTPPPFKEKNKKLSSNT
jgi:DNA-binding NarL/FixJ family response regulator